MIYRCILELLFPYPYFLTIYNDYVTLVKKEHVVRRQGCVQAETQLLPNYMTLVNSISSSINLPHPKKRIGLQIVPVSIELW